MGEGSGAGRHHPRPPHTSCGTSVSRKRTPEMNPEKRTACSLAPDPITGLLGTYFKEITQRANDDSCKHLELGYFQQQTAENNKWGMTTETLGGTPPALVVTHPGGCQPGPGEQLPQGGLGRDRHQLQQDWRPVHLSSVPKALTELPLPLK